MTRVARALGLFLFVLVGRLAVAQLQEPAQLVPADAQLYVHLNNPTDTLDALLTQDVWQLINEAPAFDQYRRSREYAQLRAAVAYVESRLGRNWREILRHLTAGGVTAFFVQVQPPVGAVIARGDDEELVSDFDELIRELASDNGNRRLESFDVGRVTVWKLSQGAYYFVRGTDIVVATSPELCRSIIARLDSPVKSGTLSSDPQFKAARERLGGAVDDPQKTLAGWLFVRGDLLRSVPELQDLPGEKYPDAGVPFLFGVLPHLLRTAPYVTASVWRRPGGITLSAQIPRTEPTLPPTLTWLHSAEPGKEAAKPIRVPGTVLSFSIYRDLKGLWDVKDRLVSKEGLQGFVDIETEVAPVLFGNRDFATEVLAEIAPQVRVVVIAPESAGDEPIVLPAVAYVQRLRHPEEFGQDLTISFQTLVGLINLGLAQNGQPRMMLSTLSYREVTLHTARFPEAEQGAAPTSPQFVLLRQISPTLAICKGYAVLASSEWAARAIVDYLLDDPAADALTAHNEILELDVNALVRLIEMNRQALIDARITQAGVDPTQAEGEIDSLIQALRMFQTARYTRGLNEREMYLRVDLDRN